MHVRCVNCMICSAHSMQRMGFGRLSQGREFAYHRLAVATVASSARTCLLCTHMCVGLEPCYSESIDAS